MPHIFVLCNHAVWTGRSDDGSPYHSSSPGWNTVYQECGRHMSYTLWKGSPAERERDREGQTSETVSVQSEFVYVCVSLTPVLTNDSMILSLSASVSPCFILIRFLSKHFMAYLRYTQQVSGCFYVNPNLASFCFNPYRRLTFSPCLLFCIRKPLRTPLCQ